jgi:hypothetical protein
MSGLTRDGVRERLLAYTVLKDCNRDDARRIVWTALSIDARVEPRGVPPGWMRPGRVPEIPPLWPSSYALKRAEGHWRGIDEQERKDRAILMRARRERERERYRKWNEAFIGPPAPSFWEIESRKLEELMAGPNWKWRPSGWDDAKSGGIVVGAPESPGARQTE